MKHLLFFFFILTLSGITSISAASRTTTLPYTVRHATTINSQIVSGTLSLHAVARGWLPMYYVDDFPRYYGGGTGGSLILDEWDQIDPVETVLFS
jgi:hypothetical protein